MGIVGDLDKYTQFSTAEAMTAAAANPGRRWARGSAWGSGSAWPGGRTLGQPPRRRPPPAQAAPPPPPPAEAQWHVAENGQTKGPFGARDLERMAREGTFTRDTHVWTAGQDGWKRAAEVAALASVFAQVPPPPPPG